MIKGCNHRTAVFSRFPAMARENLTQCAEWLANAGKTLPRPIRWLLIAAVLNEVRGVVLAAPVLWAMYQQSTAMAVWVGVCTLAGIALSVVLPVWIGRKVAGPITSAVCWLAWRLK